MKDVRDSKTIDLVGEPKRGRGRPRNEDGALTSAQRQKAYRERIRAAGADFLTVSLPKELIERLEDFCKFKDIAKDDAVEKALVQFFRKR